MEDRRKNQRFELNDNCFLNHSEVVGTIVDISMGGISCSCLDQNHCHQSVLKQVDIYCRKKGLWAEELPIRFLGSNAFPGRFSEEFSVRKCRLQFVQLAEEQAGQLENLILNSVLP